MARCLFATLLVASACAHAVGVGGTHSLVRVDSEPDGPNCVDGGVAINTGIDLDDDGFLDDNEITSTQYVCNGESDVACNGGTIVSGTIAVQSSADLDALAGANCVDGDLLIAGSDLASLDP